MRFSIDIQFRKDGKFEANCPEFGISSVGESLTEVIDEVKTMLVFHMSSWHEFEVSSADSMDEEQIAKKISKALKHKNLHVPRNPKVH